MGGNREHRQASKTWRHIFYRAIQPQSACSLLAEDQTVLQSLSSIREKSSNHGLWKLWDGVCMAALRSPLSVTKDKRRGMDYWRDIEDWLGGLPYEYCKPDEVIDRLVPQGFALQKLTTTYGHGCNEFVFRRASNDA